MTVPGSFDEAVGPFYDANGAARRMRLTTQTVRRRAQCHRLLACPTTEDRLVFPVFQFNPDGTAVAGLEQVLTALASGTQDRWQVALWLSTPNDQLNGRTPRDALKAGASVAVQSVAEQTASRWRH